METQLLCYRETAFLKFNTADNYSGKFRKKPLKNGPTQQHLLRTSYHTLSPHQSGSFKE